MLGLTKNKYLAIGAFALIIMATSAYAIFTDAKTNPEIISISAVAREVKDNNVKELVRDGSKLEITLVDGSVKESEVNDDESLTEVFNAFDTSLDPNKINIEIKDESDNSILFLLFLLLINFLPIIYYIVFTVSVIITLYILFKAIALKK